MCAEILLSHLLGLLFTFTGRPLTLRLVKDAYHEASCIDMISEMEKLL